MPQIVDNAIAVRIIYLLVLPFEKWEAFKEGIIDSDGVKLKDTTSPNWTMLHRLIWRLKLILGKIPFGKSHLASTAAAYLLVKERYEQDQDDESITESLLIEFENKRSTYSFKNYREITKLLEEVPGVATANVASTGSDPIPVVNKKRKKIRAPNDTPRHISDFI